MLFEDFVLKVKCILLITLSALILGNLCAYNRCRAMSATVTLLPFMPSSFCCMYCLEHCITQKIHMINVIKIAVISTYMFF